MSVSLGTLAPYAAFEEHGKGRRYAEPSAPYRGEYQRDRDRIIHSTAFRRLVYKTQVFVNHEGDLYRTRLTHSLEVAQIARTVAQALRLNETLVEAISLAHDLGHTPFGHAGQDALNACMRDFGGFEHNLQSLRVVDELEEKYASFAGLNLTFETREGILKHCSAKNARELGEIGQRFLDRHQPGLEAQIANIADAIAYNNHDVDDGFRAELLSLDELRQQALFNEQYLDVQETYPQLVDRRLIYEIIRRMINKVVTDLIDTTQQRIAVIAPGSIQDVREHTEPIVAFSDEIGRAHV
jgi:dGTPase